MKKQIFTFFFMFLVIAHCLDAQTWQGSGITTGLTYRDGNVLIGSTTLSGSFASDRVLQVKGNNSLVTLYSSAYSGHFLVAFYPQWGYAGFISDQYPIKFNIGGPERMRMLTDGNIGIGTLLANNPNGYRLAVNGKIGAKEVQVENTSSTWADYVFEPDYQLRSLEEIEKFIKVNKHLPEIPSKKDIEENGHKLGEMDVLLLKKIEELTLYMIELNKEYEELKEAMAELKKG